MEPKQEDSSEKSSSTKSKEATKSKESHAGSAKRGESKESVKSKKSDSAEKSSTRSKEMSKSKENVVAASKPTKTNQARGSTKEDLLSCRFVVLYIFAVILLVYCSAVMFFGNFVCREIEYRCIGDHGAFYGHLCEPSYLTWELGCVAYNTEDEVLDKCRRTFGHTHNTHRLPGRSKICEGWKIFGDLGDLF